MATLRSWEARHGQPRARPRAGGHRRYDADTVEVVRGILERRAAGLTLEAAVAAVEGAAPRGTSVFAAVRQRHPDLTVQTLSKETLVAVTRALEDEYVARATRAVLFGSFQRSRFFRQSEARWRELAHEADLTVVFADFASAEPGAADPDGMLRVDVDATSVLQREWFVVCDSPGFAVALAGRETLGSGPGESARHFEVWWSLDPAVVRTAARECAAKLGPAVRTASVESALARLHDPAPAGSSDLRRATSLFHRVVAYLDATAAHPSEPE